MGDRLGAGDGERLQSVDVLRIEGVQAAQVVGRGAGLQPAVGAGEPALKLQLQGGGPARRRQPGTDVLRTALRRWQDVVSTVDAMRDVGADRLHHYMLETMYS